MTFQARVRLVSWIAAAAIAVPSVLVAQQSAPGQPPSKQPREVPRPAAGTTAYQTQDLLDDMNHLKPEDLTALRARADMGDPHAQVVLGLAYETGGAGLMAQQAEALAWFLKAADQGVAWAEGWAADFYFAGGPTVKRDLDRALTMYKSAANHGDTRAAFAAAQMYFYGDGVMTNHREAASWFRQALPEDPELVQRMVELSEAACETQFCVSLRQVMGAIMTSGGDRFIDGWDDMHREWDAAVKLPDSERCGLTSSDKTSSGDVQNYFCDSATIADDAKGTAMAKQLADDVEKALPKGFTRNERPEGRQGPATFFAKDGHAHVRVSFNTTPGAASRRVTLLVGP